MPTVNKADVKKVDIKSKKKSLQALMKKRANIQIALALGFLILNFVLFFVTKKVAYIPLIIIPFMVISVFIWSRGFCGWACPRAAFLERFMKHISLNKPVPKWMQSLWVSAFIFYRIFLVSSIAGIPTSSSVSSLSHKKG